MLYLTVSVVKTSAMRFWFFFFFQAEDGIRDLTVTGVQTCALPISPPTPTAETPSISNGRSLFNKIGCALCHTPSLTTGKSSNAAFDQKPVNLFSDLLLHNMGPGLADNILQGNARGDEFRTAPLWGLGQRKFLLHDGRTTDLREAIMAHRSFGNLQFGPSEANLVIQIFDALGGADTQDIFNFLRSL